MLLSQPIKSLPHLIRAKRFSCGLSVDPTGTGLESIPVPGGATPGVHYVKGGRLKTLPEKPGAWASWDIGTEAWVDARTPEDFAAQAEETAREARAHRDQLLSACDWTQGPDAPVDATAWRAYRQALRDVTRQAGFPENVTWPDRPTGKIQEG